MIAVPSTLRSEESDVGQTARKRKPAASPEETFGELVGVSQRLVTYHGHAADHPPAYLVPKLAVGDRKAVLKILDVLLVPPKLKQGGRR